MPITPLPAAPSPTDDRATFAAKSFAHVAALSAFVSEANALAQSVTDLEALAEAHASDAAAERGAAEAAAAQSAFSASVSKWVSDAVYAEGAQVYSPLTFVTYRRKTPGTGALDPSTDPERWEPLWASMRLARDMGRARYANAVSGATVQAGGQYAVSTESSAVTLYLPAAASTLPGDRVEFFNVMSSWGRPHAFVIDRPSAGIYIQGRDEQLRVDLPMTAIALVCRYSSGGVVYWNLA